MASPDIKHLPPSPALDGPLAELSFGRLTASIDWLVESVKLLEEGLFQVAGALKNLGGSSGDPNVELLNRMSNLEAAQLETQANLKQQIEALVGPMLEDLQKAASEKSPSEKSEHEEPPPVVSPDQPFDMSILTALQNEVNALKGGVQDLQVKAEEQEAREAGRKPVDVPDPFAELNKHLQSNGLLFGEGEGVVSLCQVLVKLRNEINGCPQFKHLEDQKIALEDKIAEVEQAAAADAEERAQVAAEESRRLDERLVKVENTVQELVAKNEADGDVAGRLRGLTLRVDAIEDREQEAAEARAREEELQAEIEEAKKRQKGGPMTLEDLGKVDLHDEVRRLRSMIECMEAAMPPEARQTLAFFKKGGPGAAEIQGAPSPVADSFRGSPSPGGGFSPAGMTDEDLVSFRAQTDEVIAKHAQAQRRELQNMNTKLKVNERDLSALDAKVDDMWRRLPKVIALLEPMQAFMNQTGALGSGATLGDGFGDMPASDVETTVHSGPTSGRTASEYDPSARALPPWELQQFGDPPAGQTGPLAEVSLSDMTTAPSDRGLPSDKGAQSDKGGPSAKAAAGDKGGRAKGADKGGPDASTAPTAAATGASGDKGGRAKVAISDKGGPGAKRASADKGAPSATGPSAKGGRPSDKGAPSASGATDMGAPSGAISADGARSEMEEPSDVGEPSDSGAPNARPSGAPPSDMGAPSDTGAPSDSGAPSAAPSGAPSGAARGPSSNITSSDTGVHSDRALPSDRGAPSESFQPATTGTTQLPRGWTGPAGPAGPPGPAGPAGPAGPPGPAGQRQATFLGPSWMNKNAAEKSSALSPPPKMAPLVTGAAGTGQAEMNVLTGVIRTALQKSLEEIHSDLMEELHRLRAEFQSLVGNKAGMHELLALSSRVDAWSQQRSRASQRHEAAAARDRSISPMSNQGDSRADFVASMKRTKLPTTSGASPLSEKKKGHTCHERCKEPTCPRALAMSQSLSRLPALKVAQ